MEKAKLHSIDDLKINPKIKSFLCLSALPFPYYCSVCSEMFQGAHRPYLSLTYSAFN